jgi:sarcosine oxidase delta subunit
MILGKCPYCKGNVQAIKSTAKGKKVTLYACENAKKEYDDSEQFVFTSDSTCTFRVYSNVFLRWNKRSFSKYEMKKLLEDEQVIVRLHGRSGTNEYFKYVITDKEYGVSILWDEEVTIAQDEL